VVRESQKVENRWLRGNIGHWSEEFESQFIPQGLGKYKGGASGTATLPRLCKLRVRLAPQSERRSLPCSPPRTWPYIRQAATGSGVESLRTIQSCSRSPTAGAADRSSPGLGGSSCSSGRGWSSGRHPAGSSASGPAPRDPRVCCQRSPGQKKVVDEDMRI